MAKNRAHRLTSSKGYTERIIATRDPIPTFLIVCEGEKTEPNYFRSFPVNTRPEITIIGAGCETIAVVNKAIELMVNRAFDQVWCVFDRDPSRVNNTAQRFNAALRLAEKEDIKVAYSNECFEL